MSVMDKQPIKPEKIRTPIQLLGAWLAGLFAIDSCFLFAAASMDQGSWESGALVIASVVNVPLFIGAVFLLQTKFRPELQEDSYYSTYLSQKTNEVIHVPRTERALRDVEKRLERVEQLAQSAVSQDAPTMTLSSLHFGINKHLPDKEAIAKKLTEFDAVLYSLFGGDTQPPERTAAISQHLPGFIRREIVRILPDLGFNYFTYFDSQVEGAEEDVLLGAYGDRGFEISEVTFEGNENQEATPAG